MPDLHSKIILSSKTVIISISLFTIYSSYSVTRFICVCSNCRISSFHFLTFPVRHPWLQLMPSFHLSINLICNCIVLGILVYSHFSSVTSFYRYVPTQPYFPSNNKAYSRLPILFNDRLRISLSFLHFILILIVIVVLTHPQSAVST